MYHIIINPASRSGRGIKLWKEQVKPALDNEGVSYQPYFSERSGDVARIARDILASCPERPITLIVLGGDGTMNELLQGIDDTSDIIMGYIPTGSSNDFARDLKIPKDPKAALDLILHTGTPQPMDLGTVVFPDGEARKFAVSCGIGYDAAVCVEAMKSKFKDTLNKIGLGKLTYLGIALKQLIATKKVSCRLILDDGEPIELKNMLFTASMIHRYEGGGFMFAPHADANDGILSLCTAADISKLLILCALPTAFKGKHFMFNGITAHSAHEVTIEADAPLWVHTDGESLKQTTSITITCQENALHIIH